MITTADKFFKVKSKLDGIVFWREVEQDKIEIKFIQKFMKYISKALINHLKQ